MRKKLIPAIFFFLFWLAVWQIIIIFKLISPAVIASPYEVIFAIPSLFSPTEFLPDVISTVTRSLFAFILSLPIGIISGYVVFNSGKFRQPSELGLDFVRSIPATALVPLFLIIFGIGDLTKIAVGTFSSSLIICLSTIMGMNNRNITRLGISQMLGISALRRLIYLDLPESLSQIFLGLRSGVSLSLVLVIVSEMFIGSNHGLGKVINDMRYSDQTPKLYCALLMTGVIGYFYNWILIKSEKWIMHWKGN
ncbi:MAG: ABC transporter permease subunit [Melioribacter sp.]|nr:ABC transporter permease subunit [Melioribacter sp.]